VSTGSDLEVDEDNYNSSTDVISSSSAAVSVSQATTSNHGNRDSACIMSADESAECSDCSLLRPDQHQPQQQDDQCGKCCVYAN